MEHSAGIILFRENKNNEVEFLMTTPGGPFWEKNKLWSFPKGHVEKIDSDDSKTACREFWEETSYDLNSYDYYDFGKVKQNSNKIVHVFCTYDKENKCKTELMHCPIKTDIEYPPNSGKIIKIDEISEYRWMTLPTIMLNNYIKCYLFIYKEINDNFNFYKKYCYKNESNKIK